MTKNGRIKLGKNIRKIAKDKKMYIVELARRVGVEKKAVYTWLNGEFTPKQEHLGAVAKVLGVDTKDLLKGITKAELRGNEYENPQANLLIAYRELKKSHPDGTFVLCCLEDYKRYNIQTGKKIRVMQEEMENDE